MTKNFKKVFGTITTICFAIVMVVYHVTFPEQPLPKTSDIEVYNSIPSTYFGKYQPEHEISINKYITKLSYLEIRKNRLTLENFDAIKSKFLKNGWHIIYHTQHFYQLCHGDKIYLSVLYPTEKTEYDKDGNKVGFSDINK